MENRLTAEQLERSLKVLNLTADSVLFVDIDQIDLMGLEGMQNYLPHPVLIVGVVGPPNVESMTRAELQAILDRKPV